ncbi:hypothetical protein ACX6XY_11790 [Streptomyces sp. O3]
MTDRPMTIGTPKEGTFEAMLRTAEELDTPDGYKAELIRGKVVVSSWSKLRYLRPMRMLRSHLESHAPERHIVETSPFLFSGTLRGTPVPLGVREESHLKIGVTRTGARGLRC